MQLPAEFLQNTRLTMGDARFERYLSSFEELAPVSIRLNPLKAPAGHAAGGGQGLLYDAEPVPWCPVGYYLGQRPNFTFDPLFHAGCYYVQEAASMFIDRVLRQYVDRPVRMLDLCAAPGGKSTAARSALPQGSVLVSNEPLRKRAQVLLENVAKWGYADSIVTNAYPKDFSKRGQQFEVVLCDVPCSGEGMFRRDAATIGEWSTASVEHCWQLQRDIVSEAWQCLRPGGLFVYSTCTFNTKENEENVRWMMEQLDVDGVLPVGVLPEWAITGALLSGFSQPVYRFIPGITRSEGLFVAVLRKRGQLSDEPLRLDVGGLSLTVGGEPSAADALSVALPPGRYPQAEVDYATAIAYLRGEAIRLQPDVARGPVVVSFMGRRLGFAKNIGTRANNLYPKEWRIKSTYIPKAYETLFRPVE